MAEPLTNSQKPGATSTTKTRKKFTPDEALQILANTLLIVSESGIRVSMMPLYDQGKKSTGIILEGVETVNKRFIYSTGTSTGNQPESTGTKGD